MKFKQRLILQNSQSPENIIAEFGENYPEFKGRGAEALTHLLKVRQGQVIGAFCKEGLGEITLVWGKVTDPINHKGYGLAHILDKRTAELKSEEKALEFIQKLPEIIEKGVFTRDSKGRMRIEYENCIIGIKDNWLCVKMPLWIVTSYFKRA